MVDLDWLYPIQGKSRRFSTIGVHLLLGTERCEAGCLHCQAGIFLPLAFSWSGNSRLEGNLIIPPIAVAFDIIGTTFSIEPLRRKIIALGLPGFALDAWFAGGLRDAFALAATDTFAPLRSVLESTLDEVLATAAVTATVEAKMSVLDGLEDLPAHFDAKDALETLSAAGTRILALSNGATVVSETLLNRAGLSHLIDRVISVDEVKLSKPRAEVYLHAARLAEVEPRRLALVSAHPWDVHGAKAAGLIAGFVARGRPYPNTMLPPDVAAETLHKLAAKLVGP